LKADNILVEMSGVCKISDFGISKRTDDGVGGAFTAMQGTVFWMAPEVINLQKKGYNFKIDIWSVGCVVLEMWAGMRPWMGDEAVAVMFKVLDCASFCSPRNSAIQIALSIQVTPSCTRRGRAF
jgi:serine/threonine protein kinase